MITAVVWGCAAIGGKAPVETDRVRSSPASAEEVKAALSDFHAALKTDDVEKAMAALSEDYTDSEGSDKSMVRMTIEGLIAQRVFAGTAVSMDKCEIVVAEDSAIARPVIYESPMGNTAREFKLQREADGAWRIVNTEAILPPATDIWAAAATGDIASIEQHVSAGTEVDALHPATGSTALNGAALLGRTEAAALLIDSGADVNARNREGNTALHTAAFFGHIETVELLLEKGADVSARGQNWQTPLDLVASSWNPEVEGLYRYVGEVLQIELDLGRIEAARPEITAILQEQIGEKGASKGDIWSAAGTGDTEAIKRHLATGTDPNGMDPGLGITPLHWAAIFGRSEAARMLIEGGADVNAKGRDESTALHASAFLGHTDIVELLLENGAAVDVRNQNWQTPLESIEWPWSPELEVIYRGIGEALRIELDLDKIKAARPKIAGLLRQHDN